MIDAANTVMMGEAMRLAALGYRVLPCGPQKRPKTSNGLLDATDDEDQIVEWWTTWPVAMIGLSTEGLLVVDVDMVDGRQNPWLDSLSQSQLEDLGAAPNARTPSGGTHFYFRRPKGDYRNTAGQIAPKVDTRSNGGYVIVPPSRGLAGEYRWLEALDCPVNELTEPPAWILDGLRPRTKPIVKTSSSETPEKFPEGTRNSRLATWAGRFRKPGMTVDEMIPALLVMNQQRCEPPLPDEEVRRIAESVCRYEPDQIESILMGGGVPGYGIEAPDIEDLPTDEANNPGAIPVDLLNPPGFLSDVIDWNLRTAHKPQPELALAGALALLSTVIGRKVVDQCRTTPNLLIMGVAQSGAGKEHARQINMKVLGALDDDMILDSVASHQAIISHLNKRPSLLFQIDELGHFMKAIRDSAKSPHLQGIIPVIMKLYSTAVGTYIGDARSDTNLKMKIERPNLVLYGLSTPEVLYPSLTREQVGDGFLNRCLLFASSMPLQKGRRNVGSLDMMPESVDYFARRWINSYGTGGNLVTRPFVMPYTHEASSLFDGIEGLSIEMQKKAGRDGVLWTRTAEKAQKLALLYQCSQIDSPDDAAKNPPAITGEAAQWGCRLAEHLTRWMAYLVKGHVADSGREADMLKIIRMVEAAGESGLRKTGISRATRSMSMRYRDELLTELAGTHDIFVEEVKTSGRSIHVYKSHKFRPQVIPR